MQGCNGCIKYIHTHTRLFDKAGYQKGRSSHRARHQRQTTDKKEIDRITNKLMNKIIIPTETMDTVATMTSKQIKSKYNTEIHEHIRQNTALKYSVTHNSNNTDQINTC